MADYFGTSGDDILTGTSEDDTFTGGTGIDLFVFSDPIHNWGNDVITDFEIGVDFIDLRGSGLTFADFTVTSAGADTLLEYTDPVEGLQSISLTGINSANVTASNFLADIYGTPNNDTLTGTEYDDVFFPGAGNDHIQALGGDDIIHSGETGINVISGGDGIDVVVYPGVFTDYFINLSSQFVSVSTPVGDDTINGVEFFQFLDITVSPWAPSNTITGTAAGETLVGTIHHNLIYGLDGDDYLLDLAGGDDTLVGGAGDDQLQGSGGRDQYFGGDGTDVVRYNNSDAAVSINLATNEATGGHALGDKFDSVENVVGSGYGDTLIGDDNVNNLDGFAGNDMLMGGLGADTLFGGLGFDTASYSDSAVAVDARLFSTGTGGTAEGDSLLSVEGIIGSDLNDTLVGGGASVQLDGGAGNDVLFDYSANAVLNGGDGNDFLQGGIGGDVYDGGAGVDTVSYGNAVGNVTANLATGLGANNDAIGDTFVNIENLLGSNNSDNFTGDDGANRLEGRGGADVLNGGGGNDILIGGAGVDLFAYTSTDHNWDNDYITDFEDGTDFIDLRGSGLTFADFTVVDTASGIRLDYMDATNGLQTISLLGIDIADISAADFLI